MPEVAPRKSSNVAPVVIHAFKDKRLQSKTGAFVLPINPEQYAMNYKVELDTKQGHGNKSTDTKYKSTAPEQLRLEFIFDNTGTVMGNTLDGTSIQEQVKQFLNTVYDVNGDIHQPHYLKIFWGTNVFTSKDNAFPCLLSNLDINYALFSRSGEPLRAKLNATFTNYVEQEARLKREQDHRSPDLTHIRTVNLGDRLPKMTHDVYSDQSYYLKVAKANRLTSFRDIKIGTNIVFPPIQKPT